MTGLGRIAERNRTYYEKRRPGGLSTGKMSELNPPYTETNAGEREYYVVILTFRYESRK
jgi:hypothetical protein